MTRKKLKSVRGDDTRSDDLPIAGYMAERPKRLPSIF